MVPRSGDLSLEEILTYELSPYPPALFETRNILRKADEPQLAPAIRDHAADLSSEALFLKQIVTCLMVALCSIVYRGRKADMIALISTALTKGGCHVIQSPGDADVDNC